MNNLSGNPGNWFKEEPVILAEVVGEELIEEVEDLSINLDFSIQLGILENIYKKRPNRWIRESIMQIKQIINNIGHYNNSLK
jgi:post-segregation antitoxin (ccd killing protein)